MVAQRRARQGIYETQSAEILDKYSSGKARERRGEPEIKLQPHAIDAITNSPDPSCPDAHPELRTTDAVHGGSGPRRPQRAPRPWTRSCGTATTLKARTRASAPSRTTARPSASSNARHRTRKAAK